MRVLNGICMIALALTVNACAHPTPTVEGTPSGGPKTLAEIVKTTDTTGKLPASGEFYFQLMAMPDGGLTPTADKCVDGGFWSFARKFIGNTSSTAAILTAKITPINDATQSLTIPVFTASAIELDKTASGSHCQLQVAHGPITFTYPSAMSGGFLIDLSFHFTTAVSDTATTKVLSTASTVISLLGTATGTPAAIATKLADPKIQEASSYIDSELSNHWSSTHDLQMTGIRMSTGHDGSAVTDKISYLMPRINVGPGGVEVGAWDKGGTIYIDYTHEKFKDGTSWKDVHQVLETPLTTAYAPSVPTTLQDIVLSGKVADFDLSTLTSATDETSLRNACGKLQNFLAKFLVGPDALVARYATLQNTTYDTRVDLRADSGCFSESELNTTLPGYRSDFVFSDHARTPRPSDAAEARIRPVRQKLASGVKGAIETIIAGQTFSLTIAKSITTPEGEYLTADQAVTRLSMLDMLLTCTQARPNADLSQVGSLVSVGDKNFGAIISFDPGGQKVEAIAIQDVDTTARALGIQKSIWVDDKGACKA